MKTFKSENKKYCKTIHNTQKSVAFLYTNNGLSEKEKISHLQLHQRIKYIEINLTKEVEDLYTENYRTLMKDTEEDINKWKVILCHGLEELILLINCP